MWKYDIVRASDNADDLPCSRLVSWVENATNDINILTWTSSGFTGTDPKVDSVFIYAELTSKNHSQLNTNDMKITAHVSLPCESEEDVEVELKDNGYGG